MGTRCASASTRVATPATRTLVRSSPSRVSCWQAPASRRNGPSALPSHARWTRWRSATVVVILDGGPDRRQSRATVDGRRSAPWRAPVPSVCQCRVWRLPPHGCDNAWIPGRTRCSPCPAMTISPAPSSPTRFATSLGLITDRWALMRAQLDRNDIISFARIGSRSARLRQPRCAVAPSARRQLLPVLALRR